MVPIVPRMPMPAGVPLSVATSIMSRPNSFAGISKYNRLPSVCVLNSPFRVCARGVITLEYDLGVGSPSARPPPAVPVPGDAEGAPPFGVVGVPGVVVGVVTGRVVGAGVGAGSGFCEEQPAKPTSATPAALRTARQRKRDMTRGLRMNTARSRRN